MPAINSHAGSRGQNPGLDGPCTHIESVTPNDGADLVNVSLFLVATVAGAIAVVMTDGSTGTIGAAAGVPLPIQCTRVKATGTTATGIVSLS